MGGDSKTEGVGRVYEFRLQDGEWRQTGVLDSRIEQGANFGLSISMQGDLAVIGSPGSGEGHGAAFLFHRDPVSDTWVEGSRLSAFTSIAGDRFGDAVALDGNEVWVGAPAPRGNDTGTVYLYRRLDDGYDAPTRIRLAENRHQGRVRGRDLRFGRCGGRGGNGHASPVRGGLRV